MALINVVDDGCGVDVPPADLDGFRAVMREAGVEEVVPEIVALYVNASSDLLALMSAAVSEGDLETVRAKSHSLKSSSGNIWAKDLAKGFERMERAAGEGDLAQVKSLFESVEPMYRAVIAYLRESGVAG